MPVNTKLKLKLVEKGIKQKDLAEELKVTIQSLNGWVNGKNKPSLEMALRIAKRLGCTVEELWEYKEGSF